MTTESSPIAGGGETEALIKRLWVLHRSGVVSNATLEVIFGTCANALESLLSSPRVERETIPFDKTDLAQLQQVREELRNRWRASAWKLLCATIDDLEARALSPPQGE